MSDAMPPATGPDPLDLPLKTWLARAANGLSPASLAQAQGDWLAHLAVSPARQAAMWGGAVRQLARWQAGLLQGESPLAGEGAAPVDRRFAAPGWSQLPFRAWAHAFLLAQQWWDEAAHGVRGVSRHHEEVVAFVARQLLDMASPSNLPFTNPQVLRETLETGGTNLAGGALNWWRDAVEVARGGPARGVEAFVPGRTVAVTPGEVVATSHLAELIQYRPSTPTVGREPVLIVPSWIMKYYILDLTPDDSLVRYLVGRGHTVFIVSWRNPGSDDAALGLDDYLQQGVLDALRAVRSLAGAGQVHAMGYCLGGTLLAIGAALLAARGEHALRTVSLLAAQVDFEQPGELGLFIDEGQIAFLEDLMAEHGYLDGRQMAGAFQLINSKDLVWSKLVHEYLMGAHTPMTALRAWNADATRLPARMHSEYLRGLYLRNDLVEGRYRALGETVSLDAIRVPLFVLATERDHVSPWQSVGKVLRLAGHAPSTFVLASGGHNVGIVDPPDGPAAHAQASYRLAHHAAGHAPADPAAFAGAAAPVAGSWWPAWSGWLQRHASGRVPARQPHPLESAAARVAAPGRYVHQQ